MKKASLRGSELIIKFGGADFKSALKFIKGLKDEKKYNGLAKTWSFKYSDELKTKLYEFGFSFDETLEDKVEYEPDLNWKKEKLPKQYEFLFNYQQEAFKYSMYHGFNTLLALDIGLGKTLTSLSLMDYKDEYPALIVVPAPLKLNWKKEYKKFFNNTDRIKILRGVDSLDFYDGKYDIVICNYEILSLNTKKQKQKYMAHGVEKERTVFVSSAGLKRFNKNKFRFMIIDETQRISSPDSLLYDAVSKVTKNIPHVIGLSGTPMLNKARELFNIINILAPKVFPDRYRFYNNFCDPKQIKIRGRIVTKWDGLSNEVRLNRLLKDNVMFRVKKEDVMTEIPPVQRSVIPMEMKSTKEYEAAYALLLERIADEDDPMQAIGKFEELKQLAYEQKKDSCFAFIDDRLKTGEKLIVFATHQVVIQDLIDRYGDICRRYDGTINDVVKESNKKDFIEDPKVKMMALNIKAGGTGVDGLQTVAKTVIFEEFPWHDGDLNQAEGRLNRKGQSEQVLTFLLAADSSGMSISTIDEDIMEIIDRKTGMSSAVLDGKKIDKNNLLKELFKKYKRDAVRAKRRLARKKAGKLGGHGGN